MGFLKPLGKLTARTLNDKALSRDIKKAHAKAYEDTGRDIAKAKAKGYRVNGSKCYHKHLNQRVSDAKSKHGNREKFISEL